MRKILFALLLILLTPTLAFSGAVLSGGVLSGANIGPSASAACTDANPVGNCTGFLICQNFEQTVEACDPCAEDNSESWDKTLGGDTTANVDYGTALRGDESLLITSVSNTAGIIAATISGQDTIYGFFRFKTADGQPSNTNDILILSDGSNSIGRVSQIATGKLRMYNGTTYVDSTTTLDDGASGTFYVWFYWTKGTGANGTMGIEVNTARTFGAWEAEDTDGTATTQVTGIQAKDRYAGGVVFDQILMKTSAIGTVCE